MVGAQAARALLLVLAPVDCLLGVRSTEAEREPLAAAYVLQN
jgi:hypothetical protein